MDISLNINHRCVLHINNCCNFTYYSNQGIVAMFFDKRLQRDIAKSVFNHSIYEMKMLETDNNDYSDLPECYKLNVYIDYPIVIQINK